MTPDKNSRHNDTQIGLDFLREREDDRTVAELMYILTPENKGLPATFLLVHIDREAHVL